MNPGGPGGSGLDYPLALRPLLGDAAKQYDLIGFDPRFVGRSAPANCGEVRLADVFRSSLDRADFGESARRTQHTTEPPLAISNNTPMLIVQAERDNISLHWARTLHAKLPNSTRHTVDRRAHGVYDERVPAMVQTANDYLAG